MLSVFNSRRRCRNRSRELLLVTVCLTEVMVGRLKALAISNLPPPPTIPINEQMTTEEASKAYALMLDHHPYGEAIRDAIEGECTDVTPPPGSNGHDPSEGGS
jgi:hypothetical protein